MDYDVTHTNHQTNSLEAHWMPFSANRHFKTKPRMIERSKGMRCWNNQGQEIIDGSSGLFCVPAGHGREEIAKAVYKQMLDNDYVSPFQLAQPNSFAFAQKIASLLPDPINRVFFVNSGSEAIDTCIKMVMAYHRANGQSQRLRFVSRERAYHGVNMGGTSLSGMVRNRETFPVVMPNISLIRHTFDDTQRFTRGQPERGAELADDLERICQTYGGQTIAAVFVEPIAGSTGVLLPPKNYLERLRQICNHHGILLVFDEVICGFGRLGANFGADAFGVTPDLVTMAKALTNGAIPMGAVAASDSIYDIITNAAPDESIEFFHGYTYSAHPAACAAGLATQEIYARENLFQRAHQLIKP
ncbi:MAG: aminotransferase class III-fold pyridoxal phosphate-dependent enzyme, partial [Pseudomonadota bacterium]